ncbi:MAG: ABC transporter permease [Eggerthellaceae bacterium]|nr:ABC transporter permease [Eggerthellaceae bacterium]
MGFFLAMLISGYPSGEVLPENFIEHLTPGTSDFVFTLVAVALAVVFGLLVYIFPIILTETEHIQPYPVWLHCFYFAADFMGIYVFLSAFLANDYFYMFGLLTVGEAIWVIMEIYCLQRALTYEKTINWNPDWSFRKCLTNVILMIIVFFVAVNLLRVELHDPTMWKFWIFTQVLITVVPGLTLEIRGYRLGNCRILNIVFICVAIVSFNPWCNMWMAIAPDFFSIDVNPWFYITGIVCFAMAIRGLVLYEKLPPKPAIIPATGKKPFLK